MCSDITFKRCTECKDEKSLDAFAKKGMRNGSVIYDSKCRRCKGIYFRERRKKKLGIRTVKIGTKNSSYQIQIEILTDDNFESTSTEAVVEWIRKFKSKKFKQTL